MATLRDAMRALRHRKEAVAGEDLGGVIDVGEAQMRQLLVGLDLAVDDLNVRAEHVADFVIDLICEGGNPRSLLEGLWRDGVLTGAIHNQLQTKELAA